MANKANDASTTDALRSALVRLHEADEANAGDAFPELSFMPDAHLSIAGLQSSLPERRIGSVSALHDVLGARDAAVRTGAATVDLPGDKLALSVGFSGFAGLPGAGTSGQAEKDKEARNIHKQNYILQGMYTGTVDRK